MAGRSVQVCRKEGERRTVTLISAPPPAPPPDPDPPHPEDALARLGDALLDAQRLVHAASAKRLRALDALRKRWEDIHGASMTADRNGILFRSLRAEVGAMLSVSERTAESLMWHAMTLVHELPTTLAGLEDGRFSERHARLLADAVADLDASDRAELERRALRHAETLNPAKFAHKLRTLKALLHPQELAERKKTAMEHRDLELEPVPDGMAWLHLYLAAEDAVAAWNFADEEARKLAAAPGETRTVAQLRSDVIRDLLLDGAGLLPPKEGETELREQAARPRGTVPSVHVTAAALALAGVEDPPPTSPATDRSTPIPHGAWSGRRQGSTGS